MMTNKGVIMLFLTILFTLFINTGIPAIATSVATSTAKEVIEAKQIETAKDVKQEQKADTPKPEAKPIFKLGKEVKEQKNPYADAEITIKIIPSAKKTFGYDILLSNRLLIHQPHIPGLPGNEGFTTRERAQKVAEFVVKKVKNNEMPPTVTIEDLNKMGVLK